MAEFPLLYYNVNKKISRNNAGDLQTTLNHSIGRSSVYFSFDSRPFIKHPVCEIGQEMRSQKELILQIYMAVCKLGTFHLSIFPIHFCSIRCIILFLVEVVTIAGIVYFVLPRDIELNYILNLGILC